jgi:TP901-1 family phage major tail protein
MAAQKGRDILLKMETSAGVFTTIGGLRSKSFRLNEGAVDISDGDSAGQWRELLEGADIRSCSISGSGIFKDTAGEAAVLAAKLAGTHPVFQLIFPSLGTISGKFMISSLDFSGNYNGEANYSLSLESNGEVTFA